MAKIALRLSRSISTQSAVRDDLVSGRNHPRQQVRPKILIAWRHGYGKELADVVVRQQHIVHEAEHERAIGDIAKLRQLGLPDVLDKPRPIGGRAYHPAPRQVIGSFTSLDVRNRQYRRRSQMGSGRNGEHLGQT